MFVDCLWYFHWCIEELCLSCSTLYMLLVCRTKLQKPDLFLVQINFQLFLFLSFVDLFQISRRGTFSEDVWMQSTPRKQLQFHSSSSESKRDTHRLPDSPSLRRIRHCSGQCTNGEVEERNGYCDSVQHDNQCHVQSNDASIEDLKLPPTNSERSDSAGESRSEECRAENENMTRVRKGSRNCSGTLLFLLVCAVVILVVALLLAWWKEDQRELYVVPT